MGAESRFNYSAVGDAVNTTARIEAASKELAFDILVSASTAERLKGFAMLEAGSHALKGKSERIRLFLLLGDAKLAQTLEFQELHKIHAKLQKALPAAPIAGAADVPTMIWSASGLAVLSTGAVASGGTRKASPCDISPCFRVTAPSLMATHVGSIAVIVT